MDQCLAAERTCESICGDVGFHCRSDCGALAECDAKCNPGERQCKDMCEATKNHCVNP